MSFENKVVVVIGGTSGIGLDTSCGFAREGAVVVMTGRSEDKLREAEQIVKQSASDPDKVIPIQADASNGEAMRLVFEHVEKTFGRLDVLVHVAGISGRRWGDGPLDECTEEGWNVVMNNNVTSVYYSNHYALQMMKKQGGGAIVNVSSILGLVGTREHFITHAYAASRGAVISMSRSAAVYYAKDNIRINVVCPGLLDTPMSQRAINDPIIREALTLHQPLSPHVGYPDDIAAAILFLASDSAKFITGIALPVDGGWTAQ